MHGPRFQTILALAALMVLRVPTTAQSTDTTGLAIRITSPQGRSGLRGAIRIVAQVRAPEGAAVGPVRFYVDGALLGEDLEGPVYAQEWVDENPFVARQLAMEVSDEAGRVVRDAVDLKPFEIIEATQITSILLETSVQDTWTKCLMAAPLASVFSNGDLKRKCPQCRQDWHLNKYGEACTY